MAPRPARRLAAFVEMNMQKMLIEVWSDYVCPFCYLELPVLEEFGRETGIEVRWRSFELRPEPVPLPDPKGEHLQHVWQTSVLPMAADRGLPLRLPPVQPRSRRAFEVAEFARGKGRHAVVHRALFRAFFEQGRDIGKINVLLEIGAEVGLDVPQLLGSLEARENEPRVLQDQKVARRLGITAVPALVVHDASQAVETGIRVQGAQTVDALRRAVARLQRLGPGSGS